jgi:hypothetical protein
MEDAESKYVSPARVEGRGTEDEQEQKRIRLSIKRVSNRNFYTFVARIMEMLCIVGLVSLILFLVVFLLYDRYGR